MKRIIAFALTILLLSSLCVAYADDAHLIDEDTFMKDLDYILDKFLDEYFNEGTDIEKIYQILIRLPIIYF